MVSAGNFQQGGVRMGQGNASTLTPEDAAAIRELPGVQYVAARRQHARPDRRRQHELGHAGAGHRRRPAADPIVADHPRRFLRAGGRGDRVEGRGARLASSHEQLFGADVDPVGQVIRINNQPFTVVGVMASKGQSGMGQDQDDVDLRAVHDGDEEAARHHLHPEHHGVGDVGGRHRADRRAHRARCCDRATRSSRSAIRTTSWCGPWRKWPACACRRPRR